ncbi:MAG: GHKL domain-containing protein [Lachnospiraceae bacterium]|nr:GHKL domain-containing protein [Lachnospiraceae bacterium]
MKTSVFLTAFCFEAAATLPYRILSYYPYRKQLRFPAWAVFLVVGVTQILQCLFYAFLTLNGSALVRPAEYIFAVVCLVTFFTSIRADAWKLLFLYILIFDYTLIVRGAAFYLESFFFYSPALTFTSLRSTALNLAVFAVFSPFMFLFLKRTKDRVFQTDAPAAIQREASPQSLQRPAGLQRFVGSRQRGGTSFFWRVIWILPAFTTAIVMMYTSDLSPENVRQFRFFFSRVLLILGTFVIYYVLLVALEVIRKEAALAEQAAWQEQLLAMQRTQYSQMSRHLEETQRLRHDFRHHLKALRGFALARDMDGLLKYIDEYDHSQPPDIGRRFCENYAANTIVSYYVSEAEKERIDITARLELPYSLPVSEYDLCSVLGNLLENALTACREMEPERAGYIRLIARSDGHAVDIAVDNTSLHEPVTENGQFRSTHHDGFGLGTASVKAIAEKYGGITDFRYEEHIFSATVILPGQTAAPASAPGGKPS